MAARARQMQAAGIDVISMSLGEPDFDTPEHNRRAARQAVDDQGSHYGPVPGIPSLRETIAKSQITNHQSSIAYNANDVLVSVGAKMAIYNAIQTVVNPGGILPQTGASDAVGASASNLCARCWSSMTVNL